MLNRERYAARWNDRESGYLPVGDATVPQATHIGFRQGKPQHKMGVQESGQGKA